MNEFDIEIPFGRDSELIEESIAIPEGCYAFIEGDRIVIRKGKKPINENFVEFERQYMKDNEGEIVNVYDRHAGLVDGAEWQKQKYSQPALPQSSQTKEQWISDTAVKLIASIPYEYVTSGAGGQIAEPRHIYAARIAKEMADVIFG